MNKIIKLYLIFLPFYSLLGVVFSVFRTAFSESYVVFYLSFGLLLDSLIVLFGFKKLKEERTITIILLLLILSLVVGLFNHNEISRRYITDFVIPFFFFGKIYVIAFYWKKKSFKDYLTYYTKVSFIGSIVLLPLTYYLFSIGNSRRLAIFPPMEVPFVNFLLGNQVLLVLSLLIIILYGKRAQLVGAIITFILFVFLYKKKYILKYLVVFLLVIYSFSLFVNYFPENLAVKRIVSTMELYNESLKYKNNNVINQVASARVQELNAISEKMNSIEDYFFGRGLGFTYFISSTNSYKEVSNAHFSPIGFLSKYGLLFTIFLYGFLLKKIFKSILYSSKEYQIAIGVSIFVFVESFFSYAIFMTPILAISFSFIIHYQKKIKNV